MRSLQRWGPRDSCCVFSDLPLRRSPVIDSHRPNFSVSITPKAAPCPRLGLRHQTSLPRMARHVAQLLDPLALTPQVESIEPMLPHRLGVGRETIPVVLTLVACASAAALGARSLVDGAEEYPYSSAHEPAGAKARLFRDGLAARLKPCPPVCRGTELISGTLVTMSGMPNTFVRIGFGRGL